MWHWELNSGPSLWTKCPALLKFVIWKKDLAILSRLGLTLQFSCLHPLECWGYRHVPPHKAVPSNLKYSTERRAHKKYDSWLQKLQRNVMKFKTFIFSYAYRLTTHFQWTEMCWGWVKLWKLKYLPVASWMTNSGWWPITVQEFLKWWKNDILLEVFITSIFLWMDYII